jgi:hypothetical protein
VDINDELSNSENLIAGGSMDFGGGFNTILEFES